MNRLMLFCFGVLTLGALGFGWVLADPDPVRALEPGTVVCSTEAESLDPGGLLPHEQPTLLMLDCEEKGQKECCPPCHACCNPGPPDYEMCCSECYPAYCADECCDDQPD